MFESLKQTIRKCKMIQMRSQAVKEMKRRKEEKKNRIVVHSEAQTNPLSPAKAYQLNVKVDSNESVSVIDEQPSEDEQSSED